MHNTLRVLLGSMLAVAMLAPPARAEEIPWTLPTLLQHVPPLRHDAAGRLPMICIAPFLLSKDDQSYAQAKPLPPEMIRELVKRGLTQCIPPRVEYIPYALALQKEGAKVVMFEGNAFNGPAGDMPDGLHHLPADFHRDPEQPAQQPHYPCPLLMEGWQKKADELRATMRQYKAAGVTVDAVWLDWEIEPYPGRSEWKEARACSRCRAMFPPGVLDSFPRYQAFITRLRNNLFSTYAAAPILEVFPTCSVTNWELVLSSPDHPTASWSDTHRFPPVDLGMFNTANPVAYGNTIWYKYHWKAEWHWPLDVPHMDRVYTQVMLRQISDQAENAKKMAPEALSVPWVDRYCVDDPDEKIPILSRERYREILRHIWMRGTTSMQIFNNNWAPDHPEKVTIMTEEVEDAVQVYDEILAYRPLLEGGEIMNTASPSATDDGPIWSGLRLGDKAVVRTFTQGAQTVPVTITPFAGGPAVTLDCPPHGATYLLTRVGKDVNVHEEGVTTAPPVGL